MNAPHSQELPTVIDRLVGGELSKPEIRRLIAQLDSSPDGWRRCALAYMEDQSWRRTFVGMMQPDERCGIVTAATHILESPVDVPRSVGSFGKNRSLIAAGLIAAFLFGVGATSWWHPRSERDSTSVAGTGSGDDSKSSSDNPQPDKKQMQQPLPVQRELQPVLGLVSVSSDGTAETEFPVIGMPDADAPPVQLEPPALTEYVKQVLERKGLQIERHRKVVSLILADGRRFRFPIDWVRYRQVGQRVF